MFTTISATPVTRYSSRFDCHATSSPAEDKRVLIVGGTGRVGSSAAAALIRSSPGLHVTLAGRSRTKYDQLQSQSHLQATHYCQLDMDDTPRLREEVANSDLVIHAAGPFQRSKRCHVLEAAIETKTAYLDVCDDMQYTRMAKQYHSLAVENGVRGIVGGGVYPGLSNVMAAHIVSSNRKEYDSEGFYTDAEKNSDAAIVERLRYSYFTAGTGGAGESLLTTSLMLLGEPVQAFRNGRVVETSAMSQPTTVDFGPGVGRKGVFLLNLPEVLTSHEVLGAWNASARFGTAPRIWNWLLWVMARTVDPEVLRNRDAMSRLASFSLPITRFVDNFVGETVAIRVDVEFGSGKNAAGIYYHSRLSQSIGTCVSAFARCLLNGETEPGIWFPEEKQSMLNRKRFLRRAAEGCERLVLNRPAWQIESDPSRLALGMYVY